MSFLRRDHLCLFWREMRVGQFYYIPAQKQYVSLWKDQASSGTIMETMPDGSLLIIIALIPF